MDKEWIINNRYHIVSEIGTGGFAVVYKAWDNMLQKFVAVKKINEEYSKDAKFVDMFRNEAVNTAKLEHENIVRVINFIKDAKENYYMVMDLVNGIDLEYLIDKCRKSFIKIPINETLYIISEIIKSLDYAHSGKNEATGEALNIIHRDISPGNIMLYFDGRIKLTDFGIAKAGNEHIKTSKKGKLRGKMAYMSPEQSQGEVNIDARTDLFSCGIVMYEMFTLEKAFKGESDLDIWQKVKNAEVNFTKVKDAGVSEEIQKIIKKALQKSPDKRFNNAAVMFLEIKRFLSKKSKTEVLRQEHEEFISVVLQDEIKSAKEEMKRDAEKDFHIKMESPAESLPETKEEDKEIDMVRDIESDPQDIPSPKEEMEEVQEKIGDEKDKTVFDFVLDTAHKYKRVFISTLVSLIIAFIIFTGIDIYMQLTNWGSKLYHMIWPPILQIDSIPSGAKIELIRNNIDIIKKAKYKTTTPVSIDKIQPGVYTLKLSKKKFTKITRKVTVFNKQKGEQNISIGGSKKIDEIFFIPFDIPIEINSFPSDAELFIDNKKVGKTPFKGVLEAGEHTIALIKSGYDILGSKSNNMEQKNGICILDASKSSDEQINVDTRFWVINEEETEGGGNKLILTGFFWRNFSITSTPSGAEVYIDNKKVENRTTPIKNLPLSAGKHTVKIAKQGYRISSKDIQVDTGTANSISVLLMKEVTIYAYDKDEPTKEINASIKIQGTKKRGKTPFKVVLPAKKYTFILENKPRYQRSKVTLHTDNMNQILKVAMKLNYPHLQIVVKDYEMGNKVESVAIVINGKYWKKTGKTGVVSGYLNEPGQDYRIDIKSDKYEGYKGGIFLENGSSKVLDIKLGAPNDGTIIADTSEISYSGSIYLDGEYIGETFQRISAISRGWHTVKIEADYLKKSIIKNVEINKPQQYIVLKLVKRKTDYFLEEQDPDAYRQQFE